MGRPRLTFYQGRWTLEDKDAGYFRELTLEEISHLLADGYKHIELSLRTAMSRLPRDSDGGP